MLIWQYMDEWVNIEPENIEKVLKSIDFPRNWYYIVSM